MNEAPHTFYENPPRATRRRSGGRGVGATNWIAGKLTLLLFLAGCSTSSSVPIAPTVAEPNETQLTLDEADRRFLWEVEHRGTVLGRYGFRPMLEALKESDRAMLNSFVAEDFVGQVPNGGTEVRADKEFATLVRLDASEEQFATAGRAEFSEWMLNQRAVFHEAPRAEMSLMSLAPAERNDFSGPWQGTSRLRLWGETEPGRPAELYFYLRFRLPPPTEETLAVGGWFQACTVTRIKIAVARQYLMRDAAAESGIDVVSLTDNWRRADENALSQPCGVYLSDYNRDGVIDMLVTDASLPHGYELHRGQPDGRFVDVTRELQMPPANASLATFADLDGDGWEDLLVGTTILRNVEGRQFEDVSDRSNLSQVANLVRTWRSTKAIPADFDGDGRVDLYLCRSTANLRSGSWVDGNTVDRARNQLLRNLGDWQFEDVTLKTRTDGGGRSAFTAIWLDANNDGRPDLYVIHEFGNGVLYINQPDGKFRQRVLADGPADFGSMGATCGDIDNDGLIDIYVANMYSKSGNRVMHNLRPDAYPEQVMRKLTRMVAGSQLYQNVGGLNFEPCGQKFDVHEIGWAYGPVFADLDNDGWLDLYATGGFMSRDREKPDG